MAHPESVLLMRKLEGKVAIVTGGASGIGEATASLFADHGARKVVIADVQDEKGRMVVESIGKVNLRGMAACIKHAARVMVEKRVRGTIVCTASVVAKRGAMQRTDYAMSKHGVIGLVRSASVQLGKYGIRVNSVSPSAIATPLTCEAHQTNMKDLEKIYENSFVPLTSLKGTVLTLKHVADAVLFLASDDSAFVTGHDLVVDGGLNGLPVQTEIKEIR
ncbi:Short-chain dehydrogenase reductase 3b [Abeliophyllum distichum]|uniref:Short-chain dehydrogenase reductase 3b n=1 Tax=Abeliophyllum distichum TaxID=126358 RepID=A0ABD1NSF5_9LAMI